MHTCAGHHYNRIWVITVGCLIWGLMTLGFSVSGSLPVAIAFWAVNGLGLSLVIPNVQVRGPCPSLCHVHSSVSAWGRLLPAFPS